MIAPRPIHRALYAPKKAAAFSLFLALWLAAPAPPLSGAAPAAATKSRASGPQAAQKDPIRILSNRMEADNKKNIIVFIGNVSAVQGDMEIKTDRLEVYMKKRAGQGGGKKKPPAQPGEGSVERLIALGNVLITQGKQKFASGNRLDYNERTGIAVLTGNPRAWENNNQIVGTKIKLFLREGKTVVYGGRKRRVSVTLFPEGGGRPGAGRRGK